MNRRLLLLYLLSSSGCFVLAGHAVEVVKLVVPMRLDATYAAHESSLKPVQMNLSMTSEFGGCLWVSVMTGNELTVSLEYVMQAKASAGRTAFEHPEQLTVSARRASSIDEIMP